MTPVVLSVKISLMRIGLHVSIAGKIYESLDRARALGCNTMQIFSRNPRGWQAQALDAADVKEFRRLKSEYDIAPVAVHIPYIINLASPDAKLYARSVDSYVEDIKRADRLGAECFVTHLGSHVGTGEAAGMRRFSEALNEIIKRADPKAMILLETTAGSGDQLGYEFKQIRSIIDGVKKKDKIGVCLDTAHVFAAGYDLRTAAGLDKMLKSFDRELGLDRLKVIHFNDSLSEFGSRVDRHQHIGKGKIGLAALKRVINHPKLKGAAFIMETPKITEKDDKMNMAAAKRMIS